jgi:DNA replication and repair protein RecF
MADATYRNAIAEAGYFSWLKFGAALYGVTSGRSPLLVLDEVAAHLDPLRRAALFDRLDSMATQVWTTGTEAALF